MHTLFTESILIQTVLQLISLVIIRIRIEGVKGETVLIGSVGRWLHGGLACCYRRLAVDKLSAVKLLSETILELLTQHLSIERWVHDVFNEARLFSPRLSGSRHSQQLNVLNLNPQHNLLRLKGTYTQMLRQSISIATCYIIILVNTAVITITTEGQSN